MFYGWVKSLFTSIKLIIEEKTDLQKPITDGRNFRKKYDFLSSVGFTAWTDLDFFNWKLAVSKELVNNKIFLRSGLF